MPDSRRIQKLLSILRTTYPDVKTQLHHENAFQLLVATILSAQCTDRQVNQVTDKLFQIFKTPADFAGADILSLEDMIRSTGYFRNKARHIQQCAQKLIQDFDAVVPDTIEELVRLPGVGRKTANVVLSAAFGKPGVVVDTHVGRISGRLGLTQHTQPVKIELDLMKVIPKKNWADFCLQLIYLGRETCLARRPRCIPCPLRQLCPFPGRVASVSVDAGVTHPVKSKKKYSGNG
ncbi:MAG: endonuclease III [Desulfatirhabdiaceae bacterium]